MSDRAPYSRVYWSIVDDPKFATIYDDDRRLATWLRLLILADQSYPASANIPLGTNVKALQALADVGLIDLGTGHRFRVHGLDKERARRRPVAAGPPPVPDPNGSSRGPEPEEDWNGTQGLSQAEPSRGKAETSRAEAPRVPDPADVYWTLTGKYPNDKALSWIDDLTGSYGSETVIRALAQAQINDKATNTLLGRTQDLLRSEARALTLKEQATVRQRLKEHRAEPKQERDEAAIRAEIRRLMEPGAAA